MHIKGTASEPMPAIDETQACAFRRLLDRLGDKWSVLVLELLREGPRRFSELLRHIDAISQRMLTVTLRRLEREGIVRRTVYPTIPPQVEYELTALGVGLLDAVMPLLSWARLHRDEIDAARARFDVLAENAGR